MVIGLLRFLLFLILATMIYLFVRIWRGLKRAGAQSAPRRVQGVMVKDEVCNTYIPREEALREVRDGREHFFCSEECRKRFLRS